MSNLNMNSDRYYAELLTMMREQGKKDNPTTLQIGVMKGKDSVEIDGLLLEAEDLYISDHLLKDPSRDIETPYLSDAKLNVITAPCQAGTFVSNVTIELTKEDKIGYTDSWKYYNDLKDGDLVAVMKLSNTNKWVILARVVTL